MKKRIIRLTVLLMAIALLVSSCSEENPDNTANIRFSITNERARTIAPDEEWTKITKYRFTLDKTAQYTFTFDRNDSGIYEIWGVVPGSYSVKVEALSSNETVVSEASVEHFFRRGTNDFSVTLNALKGSQTFKATFLWNPSSYYTQPVFSVKLTDQNGQNVEIAEGEITLSEGKAVLEKTLNAGSYIMKANLASSNNIVYVGYTDVVRVTNGGNALTTQVDFKSIGGAANNATVITDVGVPIAGTITAEKVESGEISAELEITSLPYGVSESDVTITWYNEDFKLGQSETNKNPKKILFSGFPGTTVITAVMTCSKTGSMGSATLIFDNTSKK